MDLREDQTAPVSEQEVGEAKETLQKEPKIQIVGRILTALNEKRDAYYGIVSSIIYLIDSNDQEFVNLIRDALIKLITSKPMRYGGKMFISKALARLVAERPLFVLDLFETTIQTSSDWSKRFSHNREILRIQIISLKAIRQAEQSRGSRSTTIGHDKIDQLCADAIFNCDDGTKIDTLSLVLENRSTTRPLDKELELFKVLFQDALSLQEPALRQIFISLTNKLLRRIKDSHRVVMRDRKTFTEEQQRSISSRYMNFLSWIVEFCFNSIYCNAYFGSFILTISTLKLVIEHITFCDKDLPIEALFNHRRCYDSILSCLNDSFEENKLIALELLLLLPYNKEFYSQTNLKSFEEMAYHLADSVNPAHSLTCQYIFKMLIGLGSRCDNVKMTKNQLLIQHLSRLVTMVEEGLKETQEDFVVALKQKPIYPKLSCIRALLNDIDIYDMENDRNSWQDLAKRIVVGSIEACKAVSTIVCNLNPETIGHLPMDIKPVDADTLSKTLKVSLKISGSKLNTITSQMLLISGWKTIKECSLSLGAMCIRFWWPKERIKMKKEKFPGLDTEPILKSGDINMIIDFFDHYLRNLRHRGAFEQAYNGFMMVTRRVWHDEHFRNLLIDTLNHIMNDFKSEALDLKKAECLKAYVTRRSAGLPFIVQAILNSEHKHDSKTLRWVMDCLFEVLESESAELYQRIHCLNILRALIKEHFLGEKVLPYVGKTFAITMESFKSDSFPIRNCANMLLKAIVDRTFGVNRLRNDIHRRNQLSFERFFSECPGLHEKMLKHLQDGMIDNKNLATVHSVFIVLFRLRSSLKPSPEFDSEKVIRPFIKPVKHLAHSCPDFKLRELAAKLTVRLEVFCTDSRNQSSYLNEVKSVISSQSSSENRIELHGALALTKNLLENGDSTCSELTSFTQQVVCDICNNDYPKSIINIALELAESYCLNRPHDKQWCLKLKPLVLSWYSYLEKDRQEPYVESLVFKSIIILLMAALPDCSSDGIPATQDQLHDVLDLMVRIIKRKPDRTLSVNLQAALIRFLRQVLSESDDFVDKLLEQLDIDPTASHMTPYDHLKLMQEFDSERDKLARYCNQTGLKNYLRQSSTLMQIFDCTNYKEFKSDESGPSRFSPRVCNSPRSIELMALICKNWSHFQLHINTVWVSRSESLGKKLEFLSDFIHSLPDCDIKCLALLCAGKTMKSQIQELSSDSSQLDGSSVQDMEFFSALLDELADGDHSLTIRETCSQVLQITLKGLIEKDNKQLQGCMMNLLSALIKLSQDEESEIRSSSQMVILSLEGIQTAFDDHQKCMLSNGSRLSPLIRMITTQLFDPDNEHEINNCFELLMRIVFNHAKNYSNDVNEEKERLFDKTKLNTFADHVATIRSSIDGLHSFFNRRTNKSSSGSNLIQLNSLRIPQEVKLELRTVDRPTDDNTGDYSWRLKKVVEALPVEDASESELTNEQLVDEFLVNLRSSLNYFSKGYWNVLTDTEYTYHELSLYKRVVFVIFVLQCTSHNLKNEHMVDEIQCSMENILDRHCCTTLLYECRSFIRRGVSAASTNSSREVECT